MTKIKKVIVDDLASYKASKEVERKLFKDQYGFYVKNKKAFANVEEIGNTGIWTVIDFGNFEQKNFRKENHDDKTSVVKV